MGPGLLWCGHGWVVGLHEVFGLPHKTCWCHTSGSTRRLPHCAPREGGQLSGEGFAFEEALPSS